MLPTFEPQSSLLGHPCFKLLVCAPRNPQTYPGIHIDIILVAYEERGYALAFVVDQSAHLCHTCPHSGFVPFLAAPCGHLDFFPGLCGYTQNAVNVLHMVTDYMCASVRWDNF